jgi:hypothetical protein|tara:strand:+ start:450 stop:713 length:264 start_codon:yes stop_codon:yes gene_type:complete
VKIVVLEHFKNIQEQNTATIASLDFIKMKLVYPIALDVYPECIKERKVRRIVQHVQTGGAPLTTVYKKAVHHWLMNANDASAANPPI